MISKNAVLQKLAPFTNFKKVLIDDQNTSDIIQGILDNHDNYQDEYDKISEMFIGDNEVETARNVFNFLKNNVPYYIEPIEKQTLRSPSAIVCMKQGADCKSYASFINGIMNSLNKKGIFRVPLAYRFASYRYDTKEPQHVFAVLYPGTKNEVWVDPVLTKFDQRKEPVFIKDKKIKMALIAMSGTATQPTASLQEMERYRDKLVNMRDKYLDAGVLTYGSSKELEFKVAINKVTRAIQDASITGIGGISKEIGALDWNNLFGKLVDTAGKFAPQPGGFSPSYQGPTLPQYQQQQQMPSTGISTNTLLLLGAGGLVLFFILRKK
jgi:LPXTG-motif cell wall-anchored protein